ncbi:MAG: D-alanine--D-alanine ligase [Bacteroidota bacterium]
MKKKIGIVFGGKSTEHEVSLNSASNIYDAIDKEQFDVVLLGVDRTGKWRFNQEYSLNKMDLSSIDYFEKSKTVRLESRDGKVFLVNKLGNTSIAYFDVAFPIIHGSFGEDGTMQGIFKSLDIPFVGADILGSAICLDKDITKRLLRDSNIPIADFITVYKEDKQTLVFEEVIEKLGVPFFVKPCNTGSSVGVSRVADKTSFQAAVNNAFKYDKKIVLEEAIVGKELECAILGNQSPVASVLGEIRPAQDFYTYEAKYQDSNGAKMTISAEIPTDVSDRLRQIAIKAYKITCCEGMARVDFFLKNDNTFVVNEINTIPGFADASMYPKLWIASGVSYADLIAKLIGLAIDKYQKNQELETTV